MAKYMKNKCQDIRNQDEIPNTHFFVYQNNKYPFNFDFFKHFSEYISENKIELEIKKEINLVNEELDDFLNIPKETIEDFIKYVQRETISINCDNVVLLNYLATKYKVSSLINYTIEYITDHQEELILDLFTLCQKESNLITADKYEGIISDQLFKYIDDERLLNLNIPTLYRLLAKYNLKKFDKAKYAKSIETFLFKCLDKYGKEASVLFTNFESDKPTEMAKILIIKYFDVFDFNYINPNIFKNSIDEQDKVINELNEESNEQKSKIEDLKSAILKKENENVELKKLHSEKLFEYEGKMRGLREDVDKMKIELKKKEDEIMQLKASIKLKENENIELNKKHSKETIEYEAKLKQTKDENEDKRKKILEQEGTIKNLLINPLKIKLLFYNIGHEFEGIINYLTKKTGGNIHDNGAIEVTSNSIYSSNHPKNLLDFNDTNCYNAEKFSKDFWICFDFKDMEIEVFHYSIKSFKADSDHLKSWVIEISNDQISWEKIDEHVNCPDLNQSLIIKTFEVNQNHFARYCRLHHIGEAWNCAGTPGFKYIEFYGKLKIK